MDTVGALSDAGVSAREAEVLGALGGHLTNAEIARQLSISIRTVESHVSSLLRKLEVADRRDLARLAGELMPSARVTEPGAGAGTPADDGDPVAAAPSLPAPLTSFVGRTVERTALATTVRESRLVTALGPGGVGKTRLALAVAADLATEYAGGVWYVDLVPVSDPTAVAAAVADALELVDSAGLSAADAVAQALSDRAALVVLDNCEHLLDGVGTFVEDLLARCRDVRALATSRTRLLVPFERVFPVPGLSLAAPAEAASGAASPAPDGFGDAVTLFAERARAVGRPVTSPDDLRRVAAVCRALDGSALAIELSAARLPTLGLDGLEGGLDNRLRLLTGGARRNERHSSLRAALDWSYELATPEDQALLRRIAVFAAPLDATSAAQVAGFEPLPADAPEVVADALARLADESLVVVQSAPTGTRYRVLETIRQYGLAKLDEAGETADVRERHLRWVREVGDELAAAIPSRLVDPLPDGWAARADAVFADYRAALLRVVADASRRAEAYDLTMLAARLVFERGHVEEAQIHYEKAATLSDGVESAEALRAAAEVSGVRAVGDEGLRLFRAAADRFEAAGEPVEAARALAYAATLINRSPGTLTVFPGDPDVQALLDRARPLAAGNPVAEAAVAVAEAFSTFDSYDQSAATTDARRALELAQQAGDPVLESAALDDLTIVQAASCDLAVAAASTRRRVALLTEIDRGPEGAHEFLDAHHMATETHTGLGDLEAAHDFAGRLLRLPLYGEGHMSAIRTVVPDVLAGDLDQVLRKAAAFRAEWERLGRPKLAYPSLGTGAVAFAHGLRGDFAARAEWLAITQALRTPVECAFNNVNSWRPTFDAIVLLHHGEHDQAVDRLDLDPDEMRKWFNGMWRDWYAAVWAEAATLVGHPDADERRRRAESMAAGNPVASAMVARVAAWQAGDEPALLRAAQALDAAACPYQAARTLVLAGGRHRSEGQDRLAALGAAPMTVP